MKSTYAIVSAGCLFLTSSTALAGVFLFAEGTDTLYPNPDFITHPTGYTGGANQHLTISVCVHPNSSNKSELEIPVRNAIKAWNQLDPKLGNVIVPNNEMPSNHFDIESVVMHEIGHCIGLAHPNLATESELSGDDQRYAKTLQGANNQYDVDSGSDGVIGTREDLRGDDINLNWFWNGVNDPFDTPATVDASTYTTNTIALPGNHKWVEIAGRNVWEERGHPHTVAVMFQGIFNSETRRELNHDDAAMIRLGMSGTDRTQSTSSDYTYELQYQGIGNNCDITISLEGDSFGVCEVSAFIDFPVDDHGVIANAEIRMDPNVNWHFNEVLRDDNIVFHDRFEEQ